MKNIFIIILAIFLSLNKAQAKSEELKCNDGLTAIRLVTQEIPKENILYTFYTGSKAQYYLFMPDLNATTNTNDKRPWRLLQRYGDDKWCLIGSGSSIELLMSLHETPESKNKFGLPNSGYKRCNDDSDGFLGSESVRKWANKELGDSFVQHFSSDDSNESFTFLNAKSPVNGELPWVLIASKTKNKRVTSCYQARGDKVGMHVDYKLK